MMKICPHCQTQLPDEANFCTTCGTPFQQPVAPPVPEQSLYAPQQPMYTQPPMYTDPMPGGQPAKQPTKAKGIVGMCFSIGSFAVSLVGLIYTLIFLAIPGVGLIFGLVFGIICLPCSIVGMVLSGKSLAQGDPSKMPRVGRGLGIAALIMSILLFVLAIANIGCAASCNNPYGYDYDDIYDDLDDIYDYYY